MLLDQSQIKEIVHNVLSIDYFGENGIRFNRFTDSQIKGYEEGYISRARSSAGVIFDFITDSDYIALKISLFEGSAHKWSTFDLYVDGIFTEYKRFEDYGDKSLSFILPNGKHRVTLYFPWSAETVLNQVYLSDGASIEKIKKSKKIIVMGDSITQGYISEYSSLIYTNQISHTTDYEVINQGVGGYYFGRNTIDTSLLASNPDLIVLAYGTNDYSIYETIEEFYRNVSEYIKKLTRLFEDKTILAVLPIFRNDENNKTRQLYRKYSLDDARNVLLQVYAEYENITVLSETGIPHIADVFAKDFLHPNQLGFTFVANSITNKILQILN